MSEHRTEVKVIRIELCCDTCGTGMMLPTGISLDSYPPQYPHKCQNCGAYETIHGFTYPRIVYEDTPK